MRIMYVDRMLLDYENQERNEREMREKVFCREMGDKGLETSHPK